MKTFFQMSGIFFVALLVFWGCEKQQTPPYYPPPPYPPAPTGMPKGESAFFQSGNLKVAFEEKDLKNCEISGTGADAQLVIDFQSPQQTYMTFRLRKFNLGASEHRTTDPSFGWIYLKTPVSFDAADSESEYYVYYVLDSGRERESSFCISTYTVSGTLLQVAFDCKRLYNNAGRVRDFTGRFSCNLKTTTR